MRKKKSGINVGNKELHSRAYDRAPLMKDKFPMLNSLSIEMTFEEPDWGENPRPRHESYGPESKTFFSIECPYTECISGGFDLSSAVTTLVVAHDNELSGTIVCQGWQDRERINKHRCMLKMEYRITASYAEEAQQANPADGE